MPTRIRLAALGDAPAIAALHAESWRATYRGALRDDYLDGDVLAERHATWSARLTTPAANQHVLVAEDGGELVGFACAYACDDERYGTQLDNLHVRPARHGEGIGARLLRALAAWCVATHPGTGIYLWVVDQNHGARRFYDALGDVWIPPDGTEVPVRRYAWSAADVERLAAHA
jgi:GNAT superfamily N-acetyltransferase